MASKRAFELFREAERSDGLAAVASEYDLVILQCYKHVQCAIKNVIIFLSDGAWPYAAQGQSGRSLSGPSRLTLRCLLLHRTVWR